MTNAQESPPLTFGEKVVEAEWFIDQDPGIGLAQKIPLDPESSDPLKFSIPTTELETGLHQLVIRFKDDEDNWGFPRVQSFTVFGYSPYGSTEAGGLPGAPHVTKAEWFIDEDPGVGQGTPIEFDTDSNAPLRLAFPTGNLTPGLHQLVVRLKDDEEHWGFPRSWPINVVPRIPAEEIVWRVKENDIVVQEGTQPVALTPGQSVQAFLLEPLSSPADGTTLTVEADLRLAGGFLLDRTSTPFELTLRHPDGGNGNDDEIQIIQHPQDQTVNKGEAFTLTVEATGPEPLAYQWFHNNRPIREADQARYSIDSTENSHAGLYQVMVSHESNLLLSSIATITIQDDTTTEDGPHPADLNGDFVMAIEEVTSYGAAWKNGQPWTIDPIEIPIEYVTRAGALWKGGELYELDPNKGNAPFWWVNTSSALGPRSVWRSTEQGYASRSVERRDEHWQITLDIQPSEQTAAHAGEEFVPEGFEVISVSDGALYQPETGSIKWGPHFEPGPVSIQYTLQPTEESPTLKHFTGLTSFDGINQPILGITALDPTVSDTSPATVQIESGYQLKFTGTDENPIRIESSDTLDPSSWNSLGKVHPDGSNIYWMDPRADTPKQRFYRLLAD
jgi:hypothetical protein